MKRCFRLCCKEWIIPIPVGRGLNPKNILFGACLLGEKVQAVVLRGRQGLELLCVIPDLLIQSSLAKYPAGSGML